MKQHLGGKLAQSSFQALFPENIYASIYQNMKEVPTGTSTGQQLCQAISIG